MIHQTFWDRIQTWFGFSPDERHQGAQGAAMRNAYLTTLGNALVVSGYQLLTGWPDASLWPVGIAIALSLAVLATRRVTLAGLGPSDERVRHLWLSIFFWANATLTLGLFLYGSYLFWALGDILAMMLWTLCYLLSLPVILLTHVWYDTTQGRPWVWLIMAGVALGSLAPGLAVIVVSLVRDLQQGQPLPTVRELVPSLFFLVPALLVGGMAAAAAWQSWRAEQNADG